MTKRSFTCGKCDQPHDGRYFICRACEADEKAKEAIEAAKRCHCTMLKPYRACPVHDVARPPKWTDVFQRAMEERDNLRVLARAALADEGHTCIRDCIDCGMPVGGGPTRCMPCVRALEEAERKDGARLVNILGSGAPATLKAGVKHTGEQVRLGDFVGVQPDGKIIGVDVGKCGDRTVGIVADPQSDGTVLVSEHFTIGGSDHD